MKILVVEDDDATRFLLLKIVKDMGHETRSASNGVEGLKEVTAFHPDVIFSDINMPEMDGLEMLERVRKTDPNTLVIINSTLDSPKYTLRALQLKANDYVIKPFSEKDITSVVEKYADILSNRTLDREVLGMMYRRDLGMKISNRLDLVGKIVDRLMLETDHAIPLQDRLGIHLGLAEILVNAIEHGNLGITYEQKSKALEDADNGWHKLFETRRQSPPYAERLVDLQFKMDKKACEWLITDQGTGFDLKKLPDSRDPEAMFALHGRGIVLARLQFSEVEYNDTGNQVRLKKYLA
ncbi:MAG: response regulator [Candidatus Riflebacteria bacterium]|nr:response regulator [Candidatus Riflebacteria bacterium]